MTTLEDVALDRVTRGGGSSIFFEIYCAAYCAGAGIPDPTPHSDTMRQLLWLLADRHRVECPPVLADDIPGWLLSLAQQADTLAPPAAEGWPE
jgi:hypothetical protein